MSDAPFQVMFSPPQQPQPWGVGLSEEQIKEASKKARERAILDLKEVEKGEDFVIFEIGQERISVHELMFDKLRLAWPYIELASSASPLPVVNRIDSILNVVAISQVSGEEIEQSAIAGEPSPIDAKYKELSKKLRGSQWRKISASFGVLLIMCGLLTQEELIPPSPELEAAPSGEAEASPAPQEAPGEADQAGLSPSSSERAVASETLKSSTTVLETFSYEAPTGVLTGTGLTSTS